MTHNPDDLLSRAIAAARGGHHEEARQMLVEVLQTDPHSEAAWLWMSAAVETRAERVHCLQQILRINPANETAIKGLRALGAPEVPAPAPEAADPAHEPEPDTPLEDAPAPAGVEPDPPAGGVPLPSADAVARAQQEAEKIVEEYLAGLDAVSTIRWARRE